MELKIIKGIHSKDRELLEIKTNESAIVVGFGEDLGTGEIAPNENPMIDGLTFGDSIYDGIFILRNPENCSALSFCSKDIPIFMERKLKNNFEICCDFLKLDKKENIVELNDGVPKIIKNLVITAFVIDPSNFNTHIIKIEDKTDGKIALICGDFKNYNFEFGKEKLNDIFNKINYIDFLVVEGKYFGKFGLEYSSGKDVFDKLKNIVKFYKQVFVIQSETDTITATNMYEVAKKTKKIFIENTFLCNITTSAFGSAPTPITTKKVYSYNPLIFENEDFSFKKKYVTPFYINNAMNKMKKEKYVMNITKDMFQDIQLFEKDGSFYDACVILAEWKGYATKDKELEEFINILKDYDMDYYELYTHGRVNIDIIKKIILKTNPKFVIPLDFKEVENLKLLKNGEVINV
jgi:hypothetical protein